ncbi:hypothetical protein AAFF_G00057090 [Aldrovandia affinis]|uniref:Uncharacterized protein n=1 Tax=Aldrovandia affinis TaxID=143900 RepID=A0AAD7WF98_9TELE|nr:hypothetical protein AAFF_G00057090 [Aldrovandia affinis]
MRGKANQLSTPESAAGSVASQGVRPHPPGGNRGGEYDLTPITDHINGGTWCKRALFIAPVDPRSRIRPFPRGAVIYEKPHRAIPAEAKRTRGRRNKST